MEDDRINVPENCFPSSGKEHDADNNLLDSAKEPENKKKKKKTNPLKEKAKPTMSEADFVVKYPRIDAAIEENSSFEKLTRDGKNMMRKCMVFVSEKELDDMENAWKEYHHQEIEGLKTRMLCMEKQSSLVQKAAKAYRSRKG